MSALLEACVRILPFLLCIIYLEALFQVPLEVGGNVIICDMNDMNYVFSHLPDII